MLSLFCVLLRTDHHMRTCQIRQTQVKICLQIFTPWLKSVVSLLLLSLDFMLHLATIVCSFPPKTDGLSFVDLELRLFADESSLQSRGPWETYSLWECCWLSCAINTFIWVSSTCLKFIVACFLLLSPRSVFRNYLGRHIKCGSLQPPRWVTF